MAISVMQFFGGALLILVLAAVLKMVFQGEAPYSRGTSPSDNGSHSGFASGYGTEWKVDRSVSDDDAGTIYTGTARKIQGDQLMFIRLDGGGSVPVSIPHQGEVVVGRRELDRGNRTISRQQFVVERKGDTGVRFRVTGENLASQLSPDGEEVKILSDTFILPYGRTVYLKIGNRAFAVRLFREAGSRSTRTASSHVHVKHPETAANAKASGTIIRSRRNW